MQSKYPNLGLNMYNSSFTFDNILLSLSTLRRTFLHWEVHSSRAAYNWVFKKFPLVCLRSEKGNALEVETESRMPELKQMSRSQQQNKQNPSPMLLFLCLQFPIYQWIHQSLWLSPGVTMKAIGTCPSRVPWGTWHGFYSSTLLVVL